MNKRLRRANHRQINQRVQVARDYAIMRYVYGSEPEMHYVALIGTTGPKPKEALAVMQRDLPPWIEEMDERGVRLFGRELQLPDTAATVRVRDGETLVTDGPFAETKEFIAGIDVVSCADRRQAIELAAANPIARYHAIEVRPFYTG